MPKVLFNIINQDNYIYIPSLIEIKSKLRTQTLKFNLREDSSLLSKKGEGVIRHSDVDLADTCLRSLEEEFSEDLFMDSGDVLNCQETTKMTVKDHDFKTD